MRNVSLCVVLFLFSQCSLGGIKCFHFHDKKEMVRVCRQCKDPKNSELISMGGVSSMSKNEFTDKVNDFLRIDTKKEKVRISRNFYRQVGIVAVLDANDDTGKDRFRIFSGDVEIYEIMFDVAILRLDFRLNEFSKLRFVVDNPSMRNNTAGAFQATIRIRESKGDLLLAEVK